MDNENDLNDYISKSKIFKSLIGEIEEKYKSRFAKRSKLNTYYFIIEEQGKIEINFIPQKKLPTYLKREILKSFNKAFRE